MSLYVDSSALLKRYVDEPDSDVADELLGSDPSLLTARHTVVEVRRSLARLLAPRGAGQARATFLRTGVRTLDALHLAAARRAGGQAVVFLTFDVRQAQAARALGFTVVGA